MESAEGGCVSKRVANKHGQPSRNKMYARGVQRAVAQAVTERRQADHRLKVQERGAQVEISTLKKQKLISIKGDLLKLTNIYKLLRRIFMQ